MSAPPIWTRTSAVEYMREAGRADHPSHAAVTDILRTHYGSEPFALLDCGVMSGVTRGILDEAGLRVKYTGIDVSDAALAHCRGLYPESQWRKMSATDLAFADRSFDVVNCRHLLEHLPYYETAVREIFRVARQHVAICLFQTPRDPEALLRRDTADGYIWLNRYAPGPFEALLNSLSDSVETFDASAGYRQDRVYFCTKAA